MKSVLISIQPKWCELIASGKKTVEVRKTRPKLDLPFKCYIYCTNAIGQAFFAKGENGNYAPARLGNSKIIGEFVCDEMCIYTQAIFDEQEPFDTEEISELLKQSKLTYSELRKYVGDKNFYTWHISDLVIYDKPKELSEFYIEGDCDCMNCKNCVWFDRGNGYNVEDDCNLAYKGIDARKSFKPITRPPQSWCYMEETK